MLATTGARRGDGRPRRAGQPVGAPRDRRRRRRRADARGGRRGALLFMRETVRELGERRATGFLKKFYGWYLGRGRFPRPFKQELVVARRRRGGRARLLAAAPGAAERVERLEAEHAARRRGPARPADLDLRRRLARSVPGSAPRRAGAPRASGSGRPVEIVRECGAISSASPPVAITGASDSELAADPLDDPVHLPGEAVDEPRLERGRRRLADHASAARRSRP